jgi:hypothetical protein
MRFEGCGILLKGRNHSRGACMRLECPKRTLFSRGTPRKTRAGWRLCRPLFCEQPASRLRSIPFGLEGHGCFQCSSAMEKKKFLGAGRFFWLQGVDSKQWTVAMWSCGLSRRRCFRRGSRREFSPSWEKFRVVLMTIADGAMSSLTLYELGCSKKCCESWGSFETSHN